MAAICWLVSSLFLPLALGTLERERQNEREEKRPHSCHQSAAGDDVIHSDSEKPVNRHSAAAAAIGDVLQREHDEAAQSASITI